MMMRTMWCEWSHEVGGTPLCRRCFIAQQRVYNQVTIDRRTNERRLMSDNACITGWLDVYTLRRRAVSMHRHVQGGSIGERWDDHSPRRSRYGFFIKKRLLAGYQFTANISTRSILWRFALKSALPRTPLGSSRCSPRQSSRLESPQIIRWYGFCRSEWMQMQSSDQNSVCLSVRLRSFGPSVTSVIFNRYSPAAPQP